VSDVTISNPTVVGSAGAMVSTVPDMTRYGPMLATDARSCSGLLAHVGGDRPRGLQLVERSRASAPTSREHAVGHRDTPAGQARIARRPEGPRDQD
jgi:hypothetical protein